MLQRKELELEGSLTKGKIFYFLLLRISFNSTIVTVAIPLPLFSQSDCCAAKGISAGCMSSTENGLRSIGDAGMGGIRQSLMAGRWTRSP